MTIKYRIRKPFKENRRVASTKWEAILLQSSVISNLYKNLNIVKFESTRVCYTNTKYKYLLEMNQSALR